MKQLKNLSWKITWWLHFTSSRAKSRLWVLDFFIYGESFNRPVAFYESESLIIWKNKSDSSFIWERRRDRLCWIEEPKDIIYSKINELKQTQRNIIIYVVIISGLFSLYISTIFVRKVTVVKNGLGNLKIWFNI